MDKCLRSRVYIITNLEGLIDSVSSNVISVLKIDLRIIASHRQNINDLFHDIIEGIQEFLGKKNQEITYHYPNNMGSVILLMSV